MVVDVTLSRDGSISELVSADFYRRAPSCLALMGAVAATAANSSISSSSTFTLKWIILSVSFFSLVDSLLLFLNVASVCCASSSCFCLVCVLAVAMAATAAFASILPSVASRIIYGDY